MSSSAVGWYSITVVVCACVATLSLLQASLARRRSSRWGNDDVLARGPRSAKLIFTTWALIAGAWVVSSWCTARLVFVGTLSFDANAHGRDRDAGLAAAAVAILTCLGLCACPVAALLVEGGVVLPVVLYVHGGWAAAGAWLSLGAGTGLALVSLGRFWPPREFLATAVRAGRFFDIPVVVVGGGGGGGLGPASMVAGATLTFLTEVALLPAAWTILLAVARLRLAGESFDGGRITPWPWTRGTRQTKGGEMDGGGVPDTVVVLLHGSGFNEAQWLAPRLWMHARGWTANSRERRDGLGRVGFLSINYLRGPVLVTETPDTASLESCAVAATRQLVALMAARGWGVDSPGGPRKIVLIGHSLGGYVASFMREFLLPEWPRLLPSRMAGTRLPPVPLVVAISTPFKGSALLAWAVSRSPLWLAALLRRGIKRDFLPEAHVAARLEQAMATRLAADRGAYVFITGACDPLVRPDSALPIFQVYTRRPNESLAATTKVPCSAQMRTLVPFLGHYNIMASISTWSEVLDAVEELLSKKPDNPTTSTTTDALDYTL